MASTATAVTLFFITRDKKVSNSKTCVFPMGLSNHEWLLLQFYKCYSPWHRSLRILSQLQLFLQIFLLNYEAFSLLQYAVNSIIELGTRKKPTLEKFNTIISYISHDIVVHTLIMATCTQNNQILQK